MLFLRLVGGAAFALLSLPGWERERLSDAIVLLTTDPRPTFGQRIIGARGESLEIWVGERRVRYAIFKDDLGDDQVVVVLDIV